MINTWCVDSNMPIPFTLKIHIIWSIMHIVPNYNYLQKNDIFIQFFFLIFSLFFFNLEMVICYRSKVNKNWHKNIVILFIFDDDPQQVIFVHNGCPRLVMSKIAFRKVERGNIYHKHKVRMSQHITRRPKRILSFKENQSSIPRRYGRPTNT